ncbi:MAG: sulfite oxidase-like oxidoreductase [Armatimonadota bacterium]|nr:sulfite oxidase-like oxidoreductase [Armatimonadota bacterium]MDW8025204.1 sulfite oxidase-like oxidoreductase [Armatimonadota bacterium]
MPLAISAVLLQLMCGKTRIPPNQKVTDDFPIFSISGTPQIDIANWRLKLLGLVEREVELTYEQIRSLPIAHREADFHCVMGWSRLGDVWEGVWVRDVIAFAQPKPEAKFVIVHCYDGYTTNLDLQVLLEDGMLVWAVNGQNLTHEHGYPLRLIVPSRYAWKSAKWVSAFEFVAEDKPGYWEQRGYHMRGDVWAEERRKEGYVREGL